MIFILLLYHYLGDRYPLDNSLLIRFCMRINVLLLMFMPYAYFAQDNNIKSIFRHIELEFNIPRHMLEAIAICESSKDMKEPFPWAVSIAGRPKYYASKDEAIKKIDEVRSSGMNNIDVGCMQINLKHHGDNVKLVSKIMEPHENIRYAAQFLKKLRLRSVSWKEALAKYHSHNEQRGNQYKAKVINVWTKLRKKYRNNINRDKLSKYNNTFILKFNDVIYCK